MKIYYSLSALPVFKNAAITTGTFDGVHLAHKLIIAKLIEAATSHHGDSIILTFHPHPRMVLNGDTEKVQLLNTLDERIELLKKTGVGHLVVIPFTESFAQFSAQEYVEQFLYKYFKPKSIVIGYNHHFGKDRTGNVHYLNDVKSKYNFEVIEIEKQVEDAISVSSTQIRKSLLQGHVAQANLLLGYNYFLTGKVVKGQQLGRTLGFPTANLKLDNNGKLLPAQGVYAVNIIWRQKKHKGMLNIGNRPTLSGQQLSIEANIFDFNQDIYNEELTIEFINYLRAEQKFNSLDELKNQLIRDKENALTENLSRL